LSKYHGWERESTAKNLVTESLETGIRLSKDADEELV
jgi:hypothetical protein